MVLGFRERLAARQRDGAFVCVGLDPKVKKVPQRFWFVKSDGIKGECAGEHKLSPADAVLAHMIFIVDATAPYACMYKPQLAHYAAIPGGENVLKKLVAYIKAKYPHIPVFLDCKKGDIDATQACYREEVFGKYDVDGANFNPYMGKSCLAGLVDPEHHERAIVGLCRTSNKDAWPVQELVLKDLFMLYEKIAEMSLGWAIEHGVQENFGLVMGAAHVDPDDADAIYSQHLVNVRRIVGDSAWFLIPGVGTQGGFVRETIRAAWVGYGSLAINSSSAICFADDPAAAANKLNAEIARHVRELNS